MRVQAHRSSCSGKTGSHAHRAPRRGLQSCICTMGVWTWPRCMLTLYEIDVMVEERSSRNNANDRHENVDGMVLQESSQGCSRNPADPLLQTQCGSRAMLDAADLHKLPKNGCCMTQDVLMESWRMPSVWHQFKLTPHPRRQRELVQSVSQCRRSNLSEPANLFCQHLLVSASNCRSYTTPVL